MNCTLRNWIKDTVAAEMRSSYRRTQTLPFEYDFIPRYADFYVNLLTRMFNILNMEDSEEHDDNWRKAELLNLAHGMEIFNEQWKQADFEGVNRNDNALYVAALYYLCDYEAVAAMYIRECRLELLKTDAARLIFYIISGGAEDKEIKNHGIKLWLLNGNYSVISKYQADLEMCAEKLDYESADDFFDSLLLLHVLDKLQEDNIRTDLYKYDSTISWEQYIGYSFDKHIFSFLPSQREALSKGLLKFEHSFSLRMPTSAGKSYITELLIYQELQKTKDAKILYLAPLRSLGHELREKYRKISKQLGFTYRSLYGGSNMTTTEAILSEADLFITTPETFMSLEGAIDDILKQFTLVICDEGQLIESVGRGLNYEMLLSRLRRQERVRFLFISAIIPNIGDINTWLGGSEEEVGESDYRPCKIRYGVANCKDKRINLQVFENLNKSAIFEFHSFVNKGECKGLKLTTQRNRACLMALKSLDAGSVMLYSTFKTGKASCRNYGENVLFIVQKGKMPSPSSFLNDRQERLLKDLYEYTEYNFGSNYYETSFLKYGFAVHTADLPQEMREIVETGFERGALRMIVCNNTLAEGVNFPIKTLVLGDIRHYSGKGFMDRETLMNVIGRVGRAGRETYGVVICAEKNWKYVKQAALGEKLKLAKGMLNDIVDEILAVEANRHEHLTDEEISQMLDDKGLTESIDNMLMLSTDDFTIDEVTPTEISKASLSYHLGTDAGKRHIKKIFSVRYNYLKGLTNTEIQIYKDTRINPNKLSVLQEKVEDDCGIKTLTPEKLNSDDWIEKIVSVTSLAIEINDEAEIMTMLSFWMSGLRYVEIADKMQKPIDKVVEQIEWLRGDFLRASKSILRYLCTRFNIQNEALNDWAIMVEKGLCSKKQLMMLRSGLSDRIALHAIDDAILNNKLMTEDKNVLCNFLRGRKTEVLSTLKELELPSLIIKRVDKFL